MRPFRPLAIALLLSATLAAGLAPVVCAPDPALAAKRAAKAEPEPQGEPVEISGRIAVGLDKVFIKDAQGYCLVQGMDLSPFAGRGIQAKGVVIRTDKEYRTVRLLEYRIQSPDDDSPGMGGTVRQTGGKKK